MKTVALSDIEDANFHAFTGGRNDANYMRRALKFAERWKAGERWPAVTLDHDLKLCDGMTRLLAAEILGHKTIEVE